MPVPFLTSPNILFATVVQRVERLSPGFVRVTLAHDSLADFAPYERDQRVKILLPTDGGYPSTLHGGLAEYEWRRAWRDLPEDDRPMMRSYTAHRVRPGEREMDLDVFIHEPAGPASQWAIDAEPGTPLLVSGPNVRRGDPMHGVQWDPGQARAVLLAADETAFPAVHGILASLDESVRATVLLEVGDPADTALLEPLLAGHSAQVHLRRGRPGGVALLAGVERWLDLHGAEAAAAGDDFAAWLVTESSVIPALRAVANRHLIAPERIHTQGYWNARPRAARPPVPEAPGR